MSKSLVQRAEEGDPFARRMVDSMGCAATLLLVGSAAALLYLLVWAVVFTVNGGDWLAR